MAANMERSHAEVVPRTVTDVADIGDWAPDNDVTMRLVRAIAAGCAAEPALNAWYLGRDQGRRLHAKVHLGIAMDTPKACSCQWCATSAIAPPTICAVASRPLKKDVRARTVPMEELRGQTITLSNFGMFGGQHAALVVLPPQVAIVGAGRIFDRVVAYNGKPEVRRVLPLSLTFDHRPVMGGEAARFLAAVIATSRRRSRAAETPPTAAEHTPVRPKQILKRAVRGGCRLATMGLAKGPHVTRYAMYRHLGQFATAWPKDARVLSISGSQQLCRILGFADHQIADAVYPDANMLALPYADEAFDAVVSDQVLEHVEGSPERAMDEAFRVLKPGGLALHATCFINPIHYVPGTSGASPRMR